jgi:leader peptidase (prepilin peptidase)/N-methyltransferase
MNPEEVPHLEAVSAEIVLPREAMGLGDVKFMAAIGAFLGWQAVAFSLMVSSIIGSFVGVALIIMRKREWSSRLPYGPYIALAAVIWIFGGKWIMQRFLQ